jgi:hypothetical protein
MHVQSEALTDVFLYHNHNLNHSAEIKDASKPKKHHYPKLKTIVACFKQDQHEGGISTF